MSIINNVTGTNIDINDSNGDRIVDLGLQGNTTQETTPTPDNPVAVNVVSGSQNITVCEKNLYNKDVFIQGTWQSSSPSNRIVGFLMPTKTGQKYRVTLRNNELDFAIGNTTKNVQSGNTQVQSDSGWQTTDYTYTITGDGYLFLQVKKRYGGNLTPSDLSATDFQVELGETGTTFEEYNGTTYGINLGKNLFNEEYTDLSATLKYKHIFVGEGTFTLSSNIPYNSSGASLFFLAGSVSSGASTGTNDVRSGVSRTQTSVNGYITIAYRGGGNYLNPTDYETQIEKGSKATTYTPYKTPIELCKINDYKDRIYRLEHDSINLFNSSFEATTSFNVNMSYENGIITLNNTSNGSGAIYLNSSLNDTLKSGTYTFIFQYVDGTMSGANIRISVGNSSMSIGTDNANRYFSLVSSRGNMSNVVNTATLTEDKTINKWGIYINSGITFNNFKFRLYIVEGTYTASNIPQYEFYGSKKGTWLIEKQVGKVVLDGTQTLYRKDTGTSGYYRFDVDIGKNIINSSSASFVAPFYCDRLVGKTRTNTWSLVEGIAPTSADYSYHTFNLYISAISQMTTTQANTWFSNNNTIVYYPYRTPTYTEITDSELINQLNEADNTLLPYGTAHIIVSSGDLPSILSIDYFTQDRYISPSDREALINNTATIPFKINIIKDGSIIKTLDEHSIINIDYEDFRYVDTSSLVIGQFVARKISGTLDRIYTDFEIEDTELNIQMGISINNNTNYYDLGNFLVTKPTDDDVKDKTTFEALDYTKKFNKVFDGTTLTYPCTAQELAIECCRQAGVELATLMFDNYDFEISSNQYVENETCRKVMQDIGKLAYSWVRIDWDNKCYIDFDPQDYIVNDNKITNHNYYDLSLQNNVFGPVNRVVIGMKDVEGENVVIEDSDSIATNGVTEIQLYDSNITYTPELRQQAISKATKLFGLTYTPLESNTTGHPWLIGKEQVQVTTMEDDNIYTYPFDRSFAYNGHIKSKLTSKADTKTETEYKNYGTLEDTIRKTRIIVDKEAQTITTVVEDVGALQNTTNTQNTNINNLTSMVNSQGESITALGTRLTQTTSSITASVSAIQGEIEDGVRLVKTASATLDDNGLSISTDTSKIKTTMTNNSFEIKDSGGNKLAFFGYDEIEGISKAEMDNLTVTNYFVAGNHRIEKYEENGEQRTGFFYIGG